MKKTFLITAILMLSAVWAVAQTSPSMPQSSTPGASSPSQSMPPQSTAPDSSTATQSTATSSQTSTDSSAIEGCLSGSAGSYTLTDQTGKAWTLAGDTSKLTEHVGHQVRVMGSGSDSGAASSPSGSSASAGGSSSGAGTTFTV